MNIITSARRSGIVASVLIIGAIGTGGAFTVSSMMNDEPKGEVKYVASSQKAKVMKDDSVELPIVESENTAVVAVPEQSGTVEPSVTPVPTDNLASNNPYPVDSMIGYVYDKREKAGKTVGLWGSARTWVQYARAAGVAVDKTPQVGDAYPLGDHLYYVEAVNENSITLSSYMTSVAIKEMSKEQASIGWFIH